MKQLNARKATATMYPADPAVLTRKLSELFAAAKGQKFFQPPSVIIAPHSEMELCGSVAASAISHLVGHKYDTVVVIAPTHRGFFSGASIYNGRAYQTPLGEIPLDSEVVDEMASLNPHIKKSALGHTGKDYADEFSLEAVLPHLQLALGPFSLVPIVTGDQEISTARALGDTLHSSLKKRNALVVVSTDLSHYHETFAGEKLDMRTRDTILNLDAEGLINLFLAKQVEACGIIGIIAALFFARRIGYDESQELAYAQSKVSDNEVIGHSGIVITRTKLQTQFIPAREQQAPAAIQTSAEVKTYLRTIAHSSIIDKDSALTSIAAPTDVEDQRQLLEPRGAFVSIYKDDKLVARAGYLRSSKSLSETIADVASSAFSDSSQTPESIDKNGLEDYQILVHLLSPLRRAERLDSFDPANQGALVKLEMTSAYMFPDEIAKACNVPSPTFAEALAAICLKAKLPSLAYTEANAEVYFFDIETF